MLDKYEGNRNTHRVPKIYHSAFERSHVDRQLFCFPLQVLRGAAAVVAYDYKTRSCNAILHRRLEICLAAMTYCTIGPDAKMGPKEAHVVEAAPQDIDTFAGVDDIHTRLG